MGALTSAELRPSSGETSIIPARGSLACQLRQAPYLCIVHHHLFIHLTFIIVYFVPGAVLTDRLEIKSSRVRKKDAYNTMCNLVCDKCYSGSKRYSVSTEKRLAFRRPWNQLWCWRTAQNFLCQSSAGREGTRATTDVHGWNVIFLGHGGGKTGLGNLARSQSFPLKVQRTTLQDKWTHMYDFTIPASRYLSHLAGVCLE